jgi:hypothetical protein
MGTKPLDLYGEERGGEEAKGTSSNVAISKHAMFICNNYAGKLF